MAPPVNPVLKLDVPGARVVVIGRVVWIQQKDTSDDSFSALMNTLSEDVPLPVIVVYDFVHSSGSNASRRKRLADVARNSRSRVDGAVLIARGRVASGLGRAMTWLLPTKIALSIVRTRAEAIVWCHEQGAAQGFEALLAPYLFEEA